MIKGPREENQILVRDRVQRGVEKRVSVFSPILFYFLAFGIAWAAWVPLSLHKLENLRLPLPFGVALYVGQTLGAFAPLLALLVMQYIKRDRSLIRDVFQRFRLKGTPCRWFLLPALLPIAIAISTTLVYHMISPEQSLAIVRPGPLGVGWALLIVVPLYFAVSLFGSPLGEEPGWRGYVLDRLEQRRRGLVASVFIAALWAVWHVPLLAALGVPLGPSSLAELAGYSLVIDSLYLLSGRNLLVAMLCHQGVSTQFMFFASQARTPVGLSTLFCVAISLRLVAEKRSLAAVHSLREG
jgi:membrane protease YdiL (CAAX protease family)